MASQPASKPSLLHALPNDIRRHVADFVARNHLPVVVTVKHHGEVTTRSITRHGDCFRVRPCEGSNDNAFFVADEETLALVLINACCADYEEEGAEVRFSMGSSAIENCHLWWNRGPEQEEELRGSLKEFLALLGKVYV
jgi:hypothetical protein